MRSYDGRKSKCRHLTRRRYYAWETPQQHATMAVFDDAWVWAQWKLLTMFLSIQDVFNASNWGVLSEQVHLRCPGESTTSSDVRAVPISIPVQLNCVVSAVEFLSCTCHVLRCRLAAASTTAACQQSAARPSDTNIGVAGLVTGRWSSSSTQSRTACR